MLAKVRVAGIPLVYFVSGSNGVEPRTMVSSNNHDLAESVAEYLLAAMKGLGEVAIIEGNPNSPTSAPRTGGFLDAASRHPGIQVVAQRNGQFLREPARTVMAEILERNPDIGGVLSANDFMALGALDAMAEKGCHVPIVGVNAMPEAIKMIKAGRMLATAAFDAMKMACVATEAAVRILDGESVPRTIELPVEIVHAANCNAWDQPYETRSLPVWETLSI